MGPLRGVRKNRGPKSKLRPKRRETATQGKKFGEKESTSRRLVGSDLVPEIQDDSGTPIIMIAGIVSVVLLLSAYAIYLLVRNLRKHRRPSPELETIIIERPE